MRPCGQKTYTIYYTNDHGAHLIRPGHYEAQTTDFILHMFGNKDVLSKAWTNGFNR